MHQKGLANIILVSVITILLGAIGYFAFVKKMEPIAQQQTPARTTDTNPAATSTKIRMKILTKEKVPVVIYTQEIGATTNWRRWPTVKILRKIGSAEPEFLAQVGKVGEYPSSYLLSPDRKFLLINLESKIQILDLNSKELKDLFTPRREVGSISYSPDGKRLFTWDQKSVPQDGNNSYYVHLFTVADHKDEIIKQGVSKLGYFGEIWRQDDKVILTEPHGESAALYYFDLASNEIMKTPGIDMYAYSRLSADGSVMAIANGSIGDICNGFSGDAPNSYKVFDPVAGKTLGIIGTSDQRITPLAFSPDDKEILYEGEKLWVNSKDCDRKAAVYYYKAQIGTGQTVEVADPSTILMDWKINYVGATYAEDLTERTSSILLNGQPFITIDMWPTKPRPEDVGLRLGIVGQFYQ